MASEILRMARTESLFRDVNERIAETADRFGNDEAEFVCECADAGCGERIEAPLDDYEHVRADGVRFLVVPGHEEPGFEEVVKRRRGYQIIAKIKDRRLARAARQLDPRREDHASDEPGQAEEIK